MIGLILGQPLIKSDLSNYQYPYSPHCDWHPGGPLKWGVILQCKTHFFPNTLSISSCNTIKKYRIRQRKYWMAKMLQSERLYDGPHHHMMGWNVKQGAYLYKTVNHIPLRLLCDSESETDPSTPPAAPSPFLSLF